MTALRRMEADELGDAVHTFSKAVDELQEAVREHKQAIAKVGAKLDEIERKLA